MPEELKGRIATLVNNGEHLRYRLEDAGPNIGHWVCQCGHVYGDQPIDEIDDVAHDHFTECKSVALIALVESECALRVEAAIKRWMLRGDNREPLERYVNERVGMALREAAKSIRKRAACWTGGEGTPAVDIRAELLNEALAVEALDLASVAVLDASIIEMRICEYSHVFLKPNELYRFTVDRNCEACRNVSSGKPSLHAHDAEVERKARLDEADQWLMSEALTKPNRMEWKIKRMAELNRAASSQAKESGK